MKKKKVLYSGYDYWVQKEMETKWTKVYDTQSVDGDSSGLPSEWGVQIESWLFKADICLGICATQTQCYAYCTGMGALSERGLPSPKRAILVLFPALGKQAWPAQDLRVDREGWAPAVTWAVRGRRPAPGHSRVGSGFASAFAWDFLGVTDLWLALVSASSKPPRTCMVWGRWPKSLRTFSHLTGHSWSIWAQTRPPFGGTTEEVGQLLLGRVLPLLQALPLHTGFLICTSSIKN